MNIEMLDIKLHFAFELPEKLPSEAQALCACAETVYIKPKSKLTKDDHKLVFLHPSFFKTEISKANFIGLKNMCIAYYKERGLWQE